jgi:hypothetical protein
MKCLLQLLQGKNEMHKCCRYYALWPGCLYFPGFFEPFAIQLLFRFPENADVYENEEDWWKIVSISGRLKSIRIHSCAV